MAKIVDKSVGILDKDYVLWVKELVKRYRCSQIKAAIKVNKELLRYYWELGKDIEQKQADNKYGSKFYATLSRDLRHEMPGVEGLSETSIRYAKRFYILYQQQIAILPQLVEESKKANLPRLAERLHSDLFSIPWGHHRYIIDKCSSDSDKALFYVRQTLGNGWSRDMLLNMLGSNLYERNGKALTNFKNTLPAADSDLAQELTRDPYDFSFTGLRGKYNERILKDTLLTNLTNFLLELGTGFAYVGKEFRLQIAEKEKFIDLLFYNLKLSCYVVVEVKIGEFDFADAGQLGGYVVACNHILRKKGRDNPTIGLLICKEKDHIQAQYALESSNQPLGISEYDLEKFLSLIHISEPTRRRGISFSGLWV